MKIYLINPKYPVSYWGLEQSQSVCNAKYSTPPLALATIAGLTPAGIDVEICDENIEEIDFEHDCDLIGVTSYMVQMQRAFEIVAEFRKRGKTVVLGGPLTMLIPEICADKADVIFQGEAEYTWPQFLADYQNGSHKKEYVQQEMVNLHDSPIPRMDLLKLQYYNTAAIQTTRGCPFECEFCEIIVLFGRKVRTKKISQVIDELAMIVRQGVNSIFIVDDNLIGNKTYVKELLRALIEFNRTVNIPLNYHAQISINCAKDDELLELMQTAHVNKLFIGIETPRMDSLKEANKRQNIHSDLVADIRKIQSHNMDVSAGMIVGFDHDDLDIFREQFDFIMESNISLAMVGLLQAVPKTALWKRLENENRIVFSDKVTSNTSLNGNIIPKNMTREELIAGYYWLCKQLYSYNNFAKRVIGNISEYSMQPNNTMSPVTDEQKRIFFKMLRFYLVTIDFHKIAFLLKIFMYVIINRSFAFTDATIQMINFIHLHHFYYTGIEKAFQEKIAAQKQTDKQGSQELIYAYKEISRRSSRR